MIPLQKNGDELYQRSSVLTVLRDSTAATGLLPGQRGEQQADRSRIALHTWEVSSSAAGTENTRAALSTGWSSVMWSGQASSFSCLQLSGSGERTQPRYWLSRGRSCWIFTSLWLPTREAAPTSYPQRYPKFKASLSSQQMLLTCFWSIGYFHWSILDLCFPP